MVSSIGTKKQPHAAKNVQVIACQRVSVNVKKSLEADGEEKGKEEEDKKGIKRSETSALRTTDGKRARKSRGHEKVVGEKSGVSKGG